MIKLRVSTFLMDRGTRLVAAQPHAIEVPHGEGVTLSGQVYRDDLTIPDLTGLTITFRIVTPTSGSKLYEATSTNGDRHGRFTLTATPPTSIQPGTYHWDLWLSLGGAPYQIMPLSAWNVHLSSR